MITNELLEYIKKEKTSGKQIDEIKNTLLANSWNSFDVEEAFIALSISHGDIPVPPPTTPRPEEMPNIQNPNQTNNTVYNQSHTEMPIFQNSNQNAHPIFKQNPIIVKHHYFLKIFIFIIVLALSGLAYAYNAGYFTPLDRVSMSAYNSIKEAKSGTIDTTISIDMSDFMKDDKSIENVLSEIILPKKGSITVSGSYDLNQENNPMGHMNLSLEAGTLSFNGELIFLNKVLYAKLNKAPLLGALFNMSEFTNKWVYFPIEDTEDIKNPTSYLSPISTMGVDNSTLEDLTDEQKKHIIEIINNTKFITIKEKLKPEKINGVLSYHFTFDLNNDEIITSMDKITNYIQSLDKNNSNISSFDTTPIKDAENEINLFSGEMWIGKKDHMPYKIILNIEQGIPEEEGVIRTKIVSTFKDWNTPKNIVAPEGSVTIEELTKSIENNPNSSLGISRKKGQDAAIKARLSSARASAELYFDSNNYSYKNVCSSQEFIEIKNEIEKILGLEDINNLKCLDKKDSYAVSTKLFLEEYYCVDSTGFYGNIPTEINSTICNK